jgi:tetratricopeptide (TPR) repeat protein
MPAGRYIVSVAAQHLEIVFADEPPALSASQQALKQIARVSYALAVGDLVGAQRLARDWVAASPGSPAAQATLGEVLAALGDPVGGLAAYNEAIDLTPPGARPPRDLLQRASALRRETFAKLTTRPVTTAPGTDDAPADEAAYYKLIGEGDAARRARKLPDALRAYQRAERYHQDHKMKLATRELDEKLAYLRELQQKQQKPPPQSTRPTTAPR